MIQMYPGSTTLANGDIVSCGDIVRMISDNKDYTYLFEDNLEYSKVCLASRASYKSPGTIWSSDDVLEYDAEVEPSIAVRLDEFKNGYRLSSKWDVEDNKCLSDEEYYIIESMALTYNAKVNGETNEC